ncbi:MAG: hypothetical protein FWF53_00155 [Candidatus Azobacteroides sp.]|nr:hypothetical protein [Candidatus Azobacteroides sp.]
MLIRKISITMKKQIVDTAEKMFIGWEKKRVEGKIYSTGTGQGKRGGIARFGVQSERVENG